MKKGCRIAIIGCGGVADQHINGYAADRRVNLTAFCDVNLDNARRYAEKLGGKTYQDYREMLAKEELDGISVCTPPSTHCRIVTDALKKTAVLCEKPLAVNGREAAQMVRCARDNDRLLMTAFKFRFFTDVRQAREILREGRLGKILAARIMFGGSADMSQKWFSREEVSGGGVLIDNGSHAVDLVRYLLGEVNRVAAVKGALVQPVSVEDTTAVLLELQNGAMVNILLSWALPVPGSHFLEVFGSEGALFLRPLKYRTAGEENWKEYPEVEESVFANETRHFVDCLLGEDKPAVSGLDGLKTQRVIDAVYRSAQENCWVEVPKEDL